MNKQTLHSKLIYYAGIFLKNTEDKEDAVQNAHLLYFRYKDTFKTGTEEQILKWLVKQECFKIIKYNRKWEYKIKHIEDLPFKESSDHDFVSIEENMHFYTSNCSYNEAAQNIDKEIILKHIDTLKTYKAKRSIPSLKNKYLNYSDISKPATVPVKFERFQETKACSIYLIIEKKRGKEFKYYRITKGKDKGLLSRTQESQ